MPSKVSFIQDLLQHNCQLFAALTETWLQEHLDAEINIDGYTIFRQDRVLQRHKGRNSGGVALYLRNDIAANAQPLLNYSNGVVETLGLQIKSQNFVIIVLYRQPDDSIGGHRSTNAEFTQALEVIKKALAGLPSPSPDIVLCGDFNLPHIQWTTGTLRSGATTDEQNMVKTLRDLTEEHFLLQLIHKATHRHGNTLDLCFSNNPAFIHSYECAATQLSDHYIIEGRTTHGAVLHKTRCHRPNSSDITSSVFDELNFFSDEADWDGLKNALAVIEWERVLSAIQPSEMMNTFLEICTNSARKFIPKRRLTDKKSSKIPRTRRILMRRRTKVIKQLSAVKTDSKKNKLTDETIQIERKLQQSYRQKKSEMEHKAVSAITRNSKYFFSYAKKFSTISTALTRTIR